MQHNAVTLAFQLSANRWPAMGMMHRPTGLLDYYLHIAAQRILGILCLDCPSGMYLYQSSSIHCAMVKFCDRGMTVCVTAQAAALLNTPAYCHTGHCRLSYALPGALAQFDKQ